MNRYLLLHVGFEKPTEEIMAAWKAWFERTAPNAVEHGGFRAAREWSDAGGQDLPLDRESLTGYSMIEAESMEAAEAIAKENPYISSIRIYEVMRHQG